MNIFLSTTCLTVALTVFDLPVRAQDFPIKDSLIGYYEANDLLKTVKAGEHVTSWPGVVGEPFTVDENVGPTLVDKSETGMGTAAVRFTPPERAESAPVDFKLGEYLNFPEVHEAGQLLSEVTFVFAGSGLASAGLFGTNQGLNPFARHLGFIQFGDETCGAAVEKPMEGFALDAPVVLVVVISREADGLATLTTYVDGEMTGQSKQQARDASVSMEPFVGVRFARPQNSNGVLLPGASLGYADESFAKSDLFAFALFSKALTPQEVRKLSDYLSKKFDIE